MRRGKNGAEYESQISKTQHLITKAVKAYMNPVGSRCYIYEFSNNNGDCGTKNNRKTKEWQLQLDR